MITLEEPKSELTGLSDLLLGSLGLAGVLILCAVLLAVVFAAGLFWWRSRFDVQDTQPPDHLHVV